MASPMSSHPPSSRLSSSSSDSSERWRVAQDTSSSVMSLDFVTPHHVSHSLFDHEMSYDNVLADQDASALRKFLAYDSQLPQMQQQQQQQQHQERLVDSAFQLANGARYAAPAMDDWRSLASTSSNTAQFGFSSQPSLTQAGYNNSISQYDQASSPYSQLPSTSSSSYGSERLSPMTPNLDHVFSVPPSELQSNAKDLRLVPELMPTRRSSGLDLNGGYSAEYGLHVAGPLGMPSYPPSSAPFLDQMTFGSPDMEASLVAPHLQQRVQSNFASPLMPMEDSRGYNSMSQYLLPNPFADHSLSIQPAHESLARMQIQPRTCDDLSTFMRPYLDQYVRTPNRLAFGERSIIVMSSKVAQKSYGSEKRFLCPPPAAVMIGNSWWTDVARPGQQSKLAAPRVLVSISGEAESQDSQVEWTTTAGKVVESGDEQKGTTYIGRVAGKQLYISEADEKRKKVEALVKVTVPAAEVGLEERVIGVFPSKSIKVISKPSKKRQSAKNLELCINHGSTVSLFHRLRSQTISTKYLCVSSSNAAFKGSDGAPLVGIDSNPQASTPSFVARTASWDPFVIYIVDVTKPHTGMEPPIAAPQPGFPPPPPNAVPFPTNGSQIPIYYNQTVVLQCLTSGVVSPVLIIRRIDRATTVVGGGLQEGARNVAEYYCPPGEVCGDPVSQLHKIAFEVFEPGKGAPEPGSTGESGAFLSCMGEKVNTFRPLESRQWNTTVPASPNASETVLPGTSTPSAVQSSDYLVSADSTPSSPQLSLQEALTNHGGKVKKEKRSTSSAGMTRHSAGRRSKAASSAGSTTSSRRAPSADGGPTSGALWQVDIGETSVWTIVGVDQVRYDFFIPPVLFDQQNQASNGSFPVPSKPITPFPSVVKYLPPDRASELPKMHALQQPDPRTAKMLTLYGENFDKGDPVHVYFGSEPSSHVEVRCTEVVGCLPPDVPVTKRQPILLVRGDGVVYPTNTSYP